MDDDYVHRPVVDYEWRKLELRTVLIPSIRCNTNSIFVKGKIYIIGGRGVGLFNEVWALNLQDRLWELVAYQGDPPSPRDAHSANKIGDSSILVFGGRGVCRQPDSDRAERSLETQKIKSLTQREVYNDMFVFDCDEKRWSQIVRKSKWPSGRRGHTATFIPPDISNKSGARHKSKVSFSEIEQPNMKGLLVVFGGGSVDAAWGTEQIMNELWIYNFETEAWTHNKPKGNIPPPIYEHTAELVGDHIIYVGGIVAAHRPQQYVDPEDAFDPVLSSENAKEQVFLNGDVMALNIKSWTWSTIEITSMTFEPVSVGLHGHTMVMDPHNENQMIIFGGKETGDMRKLMDYKSNTKSSYQPQKRSIRCRALQLNLSQRMLSAWKVSNDFPEDRYGHTCVSLPLQHKNEPENNDTHRAYYHKASDNRSVDAAMDDDREDTEEEIMFVFGGSKAKEGGFCAPDVHVLVRTIRWADNNQLSRTGSPNVDHTPSRALSGDTFDSRSVYSERPLGDGKNIADDMNSPKHKLMQKASLGQVDNTYDEIKRALLISRCTREHGLEGNQPLPTLTGWEVSSRSSRGSRRSVRSAGASRPFTAPGQLPGRSASNIEANNSAPINQNALADLAKKQSRAKVKSLSNELPPLIHGMTLVQAKNTYRKLHPAPTRESLFGSDELGTNIYSIMTGKQLNSASKPGSPALSTSNPFMKKSSSFRPMTT